MGNPTPSALLMLARELRDAAVAAERPDVAAKAEEAIALIGGSQQPAEASAENRKTNTVMQFFDGLGF